MTIRRQKSGITAGLDLLGPDPTGSRGADGLLLEPPSGTGAEPLDCALRAEPPSRRAIRLTGILATCLVAGLAFTGGVLADQRWGSSSSEPGGRGSGLAVGGLPSGPPGSAPVGTGSDQPSGRSSGMAASGTPTATLTGTVRLVDGSVVYLVDDAGTLTRVEVDDTTTYTTLDASALGEIGEGDSVTITGSAAGQGVVHATAVQEGPR